MSSGILRLLNTRNTSLQHWRAKCEQCKCKYSACWCVCATPSSVTELWCWDVEGQKKAICTVKEVENYFDFHGQDHYSDRCIVSSLTLPRICFRVMIYFFTPCRSYLATWTEVCICISKGLGSQGARVSHVPLLELESRALRVAPALTRRSLHLFHNPSEPDLRRVPV